MEKDQRMALRLSEEENKLIRDAAATMRMSVSAFVRRTVVGMAKKVLDQEA